MAYIILVAGFLLLVKGADIFVSGSSAIADVRRFVWLGAVKFTLVGSHLKETVLKNFFRDSTSIFFQTIGDSSERVVQSEKFLNHITIFELKVLVFWSSHNLHLLSTTA